MSKQRPGKRDKLEAQLLALAARHAPVNGLQRVQRKLEATELRMFHQYDEPWAVLMRPERNLARESETAKLHTDSASTEEWIDAHAQSIILIQYFREVLKKIIGSSHPTLIAACCLTVIGEDNNDRPLSLHELARKFGGSHETARKELKNTKAIFGLFSTNNKQPNGHSYSPPGEKESFISVPIQR